MTKGWPKHVVGTVCSYYKILLYVYMIFFVSLLYLVRNKFA